MSQSTPSRLSPDLASFGDPRAQYLTENNFVNGLKVFGLCIGLGFAQLLVVYFLDTYFPIAAILTVIGIVVGFFLAIIGLFQGRRKALIFKDGIAEVARGKTTAMRWDDITWLKERVAVERGKNGKEGKRSYTYTLNAKDGTQLILKDYVNMEPMGSTIFGEVNKRLQPRYVDAYNRGETVKFGEIALSQAGIDFGKGPIAWSEIEELTFVMGKLAVRRSGQRLDVANHVTSETPNLSLMTRMLQQIRESGSPKVG